MIDCPAGKRAWRDTKSGPMPLLVPAAQLARWEKRNPELWIMAMPEGIHLHGQALMPADLERALKIPH